MNLAKSLCVVSLALGSLASFGSVQAQDALVGTWVFQSASSQAPPQMTPTGGTLTITDAGGGKYTSVNEVIVGGITGRSEITYSVDGADYAVTMNPTQPGMAMTQSVARESDTVYKSNVKVNGQLMATGVTELSDDGNTLTQTTTGIGQFAMLSGTVVFKRN
jgi:hypothetical protein